MTDDRGQRIGTVHVSPDYEAEVAKAAATGLVWGGAAFLGVAAVAASVLAVKLYQLAPFVLGAIVVGVGKGVGDSTPMAGWIIGALGLGIMAWGVQLFVRQHQQELLVPRVLILNGVATFIVSAVVGGPVKTFLYLVSVLIVIWGVFVAIRRQSN